MLQREFAGEISHDTCRSEFLVIFVGVKLLVKFAGEISHDIWRNEFLVIFAGVIFL